MQPAGLSRKQDPFWIIIILLVFILAGGTYFLLTKKSPIVTPSPAKVKQIVITETPTLPAKKGGALRLAADPSGGIGGVDRDMTVGVIADSMHTKITGFDVVLTYDPMLVSIESVQSGLSDYRIFSRKKEGTYTVSGIPVAQDTPPREFDGTTILTFTVKPLKQGKTDLALGFVDGSKAESNLISEMDSDILVRVEGVTLTIGNEISLIEGQPQHVPDTGLTLTLTKATVADSGCRDCFTQADITVTKGAETADISFQSGGFAGKTNGKAGALGYTFSLVEIRAGGATLIAVPE